jgi:UDP-N-acetylglucosamine/UDP-N-acetylgalactosamine diphosphorylase
MADLLYERLRAKLAPFGQEHVLRWWPELTEQERTELAAEIESIDLAELQRLFLEWQTTPTPAPFDWNEVEPPEVLRPATTFAAWEEEQQASAIGERALRQGEVAICLVAGGHGSRLGHPGPKGTYPIGPVSNRSLFQVHAEKVLALSQRYEVPLRFYIMTSPDNDAATRSWFTEHRYFGLPPEQVVFFSQGTLPALDKNTGRLLMRSKFHLALGPNGHGGFLAALRDASILEEIQQRGVRWLFYFQVDNPLVKIADPLFLGQHIRANADVSVKVVRRRHAQEKLGQVIRYRGRYHLVEYTEIPLEYQSRRDATGSFWLDAGNTAIHVFSVAFLQRLIQQKTVLPYHGAIKKVPFLSDTGELVEPEEPNAVKWEQFIFDVLPLARRVLIVETSRREEFEPLKNASGENSPETVRAALSELYASWLEQAGVAVPRTPQGQVRVPIEISPLVALDAGDLRGQVEHLAAIDKPLVLERANPPECSSSSIPEHS